MARPRPCVLFAQSFLHPVLAEYVDEVRFTEPVVICACEILELHTTSICQTLSLSGASFPQSFALEVFVRVGGEARFKRICPAFLYSPSASSVLEVQAAVTDHLVIRGSYRALSLVVYGNSVKELGQFNFDHEIDNTLSDAIIPPEAVFQPEDLPEALQDDLVCQSKVVTPLRNLRLIHEDVEISEAIHQLLSMSFQLTRLDATCVMTGKVFEIVLAAASAVLSEHGIESELPQMISSSKTHYEDKRVQNNNILQARDEMQLIYNQWQYKFASEKQAPSPLVDISDLLKGIFEWIKSSFELPLKAESDISVEEFLFAGLAAVLLICTDTRLCFQLVMVEGLDLLLGVLQCVSAESSAMALLILGALKCACQHAFACEALLGWWPASPSSTDSKHTSSFGYSTLLKTLLKTKRRNVSELACQVLHHLHAYQLASEFENEVETLLENPCGVKQPELTNQTLKKLSLYLNKLVKSLNAQELPHEWSPAQAACQFIADGDDNAFPSPPMAVFNWISASKFSLTTKDLNKQILLVLQERRFLSVLSALLSGPLLRELERNSSDSFLEFIASVEAIILLLINSRSGLLFLASDPDDATVLITALMGTKRFEERGFIDYRNANLLLSDGLVCQPQDVGHMLLTNLSVISVLDRLLGTTRDSESFLWLLWELSVFSRTEAGKQALSCITYFPEVFMLLLESLQLDSHSLTTDIREIRALNRAFIHSTAEVMQVILIDPVASSLAAWVPHALSLQKALQYCSPTTIDMAVGSQGLGSHSKDALCARLLDWVDAAVIFHKKGPVGLLRYVAALIAGSVTSVAVGGLPASDPVETDNTFGESAVSTELPSVSTLLGRGVTLGAAGTVLSDTALIQLTVSMRIMSSITHHPGVAAVLFGEGAMSVLYILLEYCASVLQSSTIDYDYMVEEDGDGDGITEMVMEQERELSLFGLLLPSLLLLLNLLKRLQLTHEEYRNTRLVEVLLQLHRCTCSRIASKVSVLHQATGALLFSAVLRVIASILAFWPVSGWMPSFFTKLLGINASSLVLSGTVPPLEPRETISVLWILGDMLPEEIPQICVNRMMTINVPQSLAITTMLGKKSMKSVGWHCEPAENAKLIQAMVLHLDYISLMVSHLASTATTLLEGLLTKLIVRMACQNPEHAATLLRPMLSLLKEQVTSGMISAESDLFQAEQVLRLLNELSRHPQSKRVMVREGVVQILLQKLDVNPLMVGSSSNSVQLLCLISDILVAICDPDITSSPNVPINVRLMKDCPGFHEYCRIVAWAYNLMLSLPLEKELDRIIRLLSKIVSHQLGRAAFASIAVVIGKRLSIYQHETTSADSCMVDISEIENQLAGVGSLVPFCKRILVVLSEAPDVLLILEILHHFAQAVIQFCAAGRSSCGLGALHLLFELDKMDTKEIFTSIISLLKTWSDSNVNDEELYNKRSSASLKVLQYVTGLLHLIGNIPTVLCLEQKVNQIVDRLQSSQSVIDEHLTVDLQATGYRLLPQLLFDIDGTETVWVSASMPEADESFYNRLKDKFTWECASDVSEKMPSGVSGKRKAANALDGGNKRHSTDGGMSGPVADMASSVNGGLSGRPVTISSAASASRRDTFRQRKPNTSRPPSMHVDDYVARERGSESTSILSGSTSQRSALGGGRPPSIHVDEFMARQRDRHFVVGAPTTAESHPSTSLQAQVQVETTKLETSTVSVKVSRPVMPEEDLQDVDIEVGVPDTDDLLSFPSGSELIPDVEKSTGLSANITKSSIETPILQTSLTVDIEPGIRLSAKEDISKADETQLGAPVSKTRQSFGDIKGNIPRSNIMHDTFQSTSLNVKVQMQQVGDKPPAPVVSVQVQESVSSTFSTTISQQEPGFPTSVGSQNIHHQSRHLQFNAAPPLPPSLPPPPPIPAGVIPEKFEVSSEMKMAPLLPSSAPLLTPAAPPPPPPPPRPSSSWQPADLNLARKDQVHAPAISTTTYGMGLVASQHSAQMGAIVGFSQAPLPPWPPVINDDTGALGAGRIAPPLPPTPPPFSSSQQGAVLQAPIASAVPSLPSPFQSIGRLLSETPSIFNTPTAIDSPSLERKFPPFPPISQAMPHLPPLLPPFQPPLPPGRPTMSQASPISSTLIQQHYLPVPSHQFMQSVPTFQFSVQTAAATTAMNMPQQSFPQPIHQTVPQQVTPVPQQQEPGSLLQQILASPEAIQDLLKDQNKLQSLLEQHPKLISLLQEKMNQS
ncbi:hypothetical protein KP509_09G038400 [Ceratopteris richardii]|uniref:Virilizer N-terminal domain-containing protein n=1 Tax=Ceratopteris richardii TaxID=49495 RepID=A0A8T2U1V0_CERRI|nr:hypothetical protein KP509_09G038400 [Ceratopteris richardii]